MGSSLPKWRTRRPTPIRRARIIKRQRGRARCAAFGALPLLVTFTDIKDPTTVKKVDPDNLAATFGPGVSLKSITLEITDETVTEGKVEKIFVWWPSLQNKQLDGSRYSTSGAEYQFANSLNRPRLQEELKDGYLKRSISGDPLDGRLQPRIRRRFGDGQNLDESGQDQDGLGGNEFSNRARQQ